MDLPGLLLYAQLIELDFFPVATQFSLILSGAGWKGEEGSLSEDVLRDTIDNIQSHGFTGIEAPTHLPVVEEKFILDYAASRGMIVNYHIGGPEGFDRTTPIEI